ncbi:AhpC/TSA family protein [Hymenobacter sp. 15J16-1T3B]|uniref:TlpA disulfide reductase family protein n=1 Tax=Hymenobacter sp. 15J16-1T3B TaxID=2886941 RepID=UPI001D0FE1A0|nr:TlpA disulfide reductase family protein [Hymenobacter sp. 15J16-1T3B]MCC3158986.1 AhpC/TSA family protein [Hymenobacter sp. 15J16-1T3B]
MHRKSYPMLALAALLTTPALAQKADKPAKSDARFEVSGTLQSLPAGSQVFIVDTQVEPAAVLGSGTVDGRGRFTVRGKVSEAAVYYVAVPEKRELLAVPLAPGAHVEVSGDAERLGSTGNVGGTPEAAALMAFEQARLANLQKMQALMQRYNATQDAAARAALNQERRDLEAAQLAAAKSLARRPTYLAPFAALELIGEEAQAEFLDSVTAVYQKLAPVSRYTKALLANQARLRATAVGAPAPDIQLTGPDGKVVALSSLRGKYVMIDFWASWCGPCRAENPNVVKLYNAYKGKGFEIYGVSLDQERDKWVKAIQTDGLVWPQVSDLKGWQSAAGQLYGVRAIPAAVLIDPEGRIIAKNLRGRELERKVAALLN